MLIATFFYMNSNSLFFVVMRTFFRHADMFNQKVCLIPHADGIDQKTRGQKFLRTYIAYRGLQMNLQCIIFVRLVCTSLRVPETGCSEWCSSQHAYKLCQVFDGSRVTYSVHFITVSTDDIMIMANKSFQTRGSIPFGSCAKPNKHPGCIASVHFPLVTRCSAPLLCISHPFSAFPTRCSAPLQCISHSLQCTPSVHFPPLLCIASVHFPLAVVHLVLAALHFVVQNNMQTHLTLPSPEGLSS